MSQEPKKDPFDGEYIGNIWGWKFSFIGLGIIVLTGIAIYFREQTVGKENRAKMKQEELQYQQDSLNQLLDTLSE